MQSEPRDYRLARRAYEAFFDEQPQVWFDQLGHEYQMKWVRVARAVLEEAMRNKPAAPAAGKAPRLSSVEEARAVLENVPLKPGGRRDFTNLPPDMRNRVLTAIKYLRVHRKR